MKKHSVKLLAALFAVVMLLTSLSGCGNERLSTIAIPAAVTELKAKLAANDEGVGESVSANLYYDNTMSMYGYTCAKKGGVGGTSQFLVACTNLVDVIKGFSNYSINALKANKKVLGWQEFSAAEFNKNIKDYNFYPFADSKNVGGFNKAKGQTGPLQSLFTAENSPVDFTQLNIFITDLAEQDLNNIMLAERINEIVLEAEDHSVALYGIKSNFSGYASVPAAGIIDNGGNEMINDDNFNGKRPFYVLMVGPTKEVVSLCNEFDKELNGAGLKNGSDYNSTRILSKRGLTYSPITNANYEIFDNLKVLETNKEDDYGTYRRENGSITFENTNLNFGFSATKYDKIFANVNETYPGLCYSFSYSSGINGDMSNDRNWASFSFIIPLSSLADGSVADPKEIKYSLLSDSDNFKVYGYALDPEDKTKGTWEEISAYDLFESSDAYMNEPEMPVLSKGDTIDRVEIGENNKTFEKIGYPMDKMQLYKEESENGSLYVKLSFKNMQALAAKYQMITIAFDVTASRRVSENTPAWIDSYNLPDMQTADKKQAFVKTANLSEFYSFLVGNMSSAQERENFEKHMTKTVSDVVVNIALSGKGKSR